LLVNSFADSDEHFTCKVGKTTVSTEDIWFLPLSSIDDPNLLAIRLYYKHFRKSRNKKNLQGLLLEIVQLMIGEKMFALDFNYAGCLPMPENTEIEGLEPITNLHGFIEWNNRLNKKQKRYN
jgi:hypothetical protein